MLANDIRHTIAMSTSTTTTSTANTSNFDSSLPRERLITLGEQIFVPYERLPDAYIQITGSNDEVSSKVNWGKHTMLVRYAPPGRDKPLLRIHCVLDDEEFRTFTTQVCDQLAKAQCDVQTNVIPYSTFISTTVVDPQDSVLHMVLDGDPGRYQKVKAKCDRVGAAAQSMDPNRHREKKAFSPILANVMKQLMVKNGYLPWTIRLDDRLPTAPRWVIVLGLDVFHSRKKIIVACSRPVRTKSVLGLVAYALQFNSSNGEQTWEHLCQFATVDAGQETQPFKSGLLTRFCEEVRQKWGPDPGCILVYRDGVSRGEFEYVNKEELPQVQSVFPRTPLTFVIVQKRIQFACAVTQRGRGGMGNGGGGDGRGGGRSPHSSSPHSSVAVVPVPQGALIDQLSDVTMFESYNTYYMHPISVNSPVQHVIIQRGDIPQNLLKILSYHLCFMYPTWSHSTKVPFTIQAAHKLANYIADRIQFESCRGGPSAAAIVLPIVADRTKSFYL
jgi:hypothetical protein